MKMKLSQFIENLKDMARDKGLKVFWCPECDIMFTSDDNACSSVCPNDQLNNHCGIEIDLEERHVKTDG